MQPPTIPAQGADLSLVPPEPEPEPEPELGAAEPGVGRSVEAGTFEQEGLLPTPPAGRPAAAPVSFDDTIPLTFSVNHFGLKGQRAGPGLKRGDFVTTWRERYFVLHADGNFLVYFLAATESQPRGALPLGGGVVEATDDRDGCGLCLNLQGTGETRLAFGTAAERDGWLKVLKAATQAKFVDSAANRALLPLLPTLPARAQSVFFGAGGIMGRHTLGEGNPEDWHATSQLAEPQFCVLCREAQFVWLFSDPQLSKIQGLIALEGCEVLDSSEFDIGAGYACHYAATLCPLLVRFSASSI